VKAVLIEIAGGPNGNQAGDVIARSDGNTVPDARYFGPCYRGTILRAARAIQCGAMGSGYLVARLGEATTSGSS